MTLSTDIIDLYHRLDNVPEGDRGQLILACAVVMAACGIEESLKEISDSIDGLAEAVRDKDPG